MQNMSFHRRPFLQMYQWWYLTGMDKWQKVSAYSDHQYL
ncbi:hypothetical protein SALWKB12_0443 [Snodgrassella communis]|uniref:Uncharacterized protein n=1 Tax=Snodgrassella communis TaxID=2946699 RepID=A0A836Z3N7_9NEIS|nr:hypothetical protein SALWKB12_0443 [Snodgrassella communis]KDN15878.1 hypothetical protein SALWKB29_0297 [Snodgrassella communis]